MNRLLILASDYEKEAESFTEYFDEVDSSSLADVMIDAETGDISEVLVNGKKIENWDAVYLKPEPKAFNYTRVLLEVLSVKDVRCNIDTSSIFILTKKPYLAKVLADKGCAIPPQASISTEKGMTELQKDIEFPVLARKYSDLQLVETKIFDGFDELKSFAEVTEHGKDFLMIQEHDEEKEVFELLYIDGKIISLKADNPPWKESGETGFSYYGVSDTQKQTVQKAVESIGTSICRVRLQGDRIIDMDTDPRLDMFEQESGKNVYGRVAGYLKDGEDL